MKSYILFCRCIVGVGGSQLYVRNKTLYLKSIGWDVHVFSFWKGNIYIQGLGAYENRINPKLGFPFFLYSKKEKQRILNWIHSFIHKSDEFVIESNSFLLSSWAEVLAKELNAKHILYLLDEQPRTFGLKNDFLYYKLDRYELSGITSKVIQSVFPDTNIANIEDFILIALCTNSIDDIDDSQLHIDLKGDVKIGFFGRIDKPYLMPITLKLVEFIRKNKELNFSVVYIGGSPYQRDVRRLLEVFQNVINVDVQVTGYLCPVPRTFLDKFDFFISSAGSTTALYEAGYLTITLDGYNFNPNGIMGINTYKNLSPEDKQPILEDVLEDLIKKKIYKREQIVRRDNYDFNYFFEPHMKFLDKSKNKSKDEYYDFNSIYLPLRFKVLKFLLFLLNPNWLRKIVDSWVYK